MGGHEMFKGLADEAVGSTTPTDIEKIRAEAKEEGRIEGRKELLDWLQFAYLDDSGRPDRGSPKADAILEMARDAANHFKIKLEMGRR